MQEHINHHYVSECHLKEFFNTEDGQIYLFDKQLNNFYQKPGTGRIFSEKDLNTKLLGDKVDRQSMEIELQVLFEDNFAKHLDVVKRFHENHQAIEKVYEDMNYLALMALVGEYRNPRYKTGLDQAMDALKMQITGSNEPDPKLKYQNTKSYLDVAHMLLTDMDPITFAIVVINTNDHFVVPDTSGFLARQNLYVGHIMQLGLPISDKVFLLGRSARMGNYPTTLVTIEDEDSEIVFRINSDLINYAYKTVACKDQIFLEKTIKKMHQKGFIGQYFQEFTIAQPS